MGVPSARQGQELALRDRDGVVYAVYLLQKVMYPYSCKQSMGLIEATMKQRELGMMNGMLERNSLAHAWLTCTKPFLRKSSDDMSLVRT